MTFVTPKPVNNGLGRLAAINVLVSVPRFCPKTLAVNPAPDPAPASALPKDNGKVNVLPAKKSVIAFAIVLPGAVRPVETGAQVLITDV